MQKSAIQARARRDAKTLRPALPIGLLQIDQHGVGGEERDDHREEIDEIAHGNDAAGDRGEMRE